MDLAFDANWDLGRSETVQMLAEMIKEGLIDVIGGGPPCATWSALRFRPEGPRPVRFRGDQAWGRYDLTVKEQEILAIANKLMLNFLTLCEMAHQA